MPAADKLRQVMTGGGGLRSLGAPARPTNLTPEGGPSTSFPGNIGSENPRFVQAGAENEAINQRVEQQRKVGGVIAEMTGGMGGGGLLAMGGRRLGLQGFKALMAARMAGAGIGEGAVSGALAGPDEDLFTRAAEGAARGALGEALGVPAERFVLRPLGRQVGKLPGFRKIMAPFKGQLEAGAEEASRTLQAHGATPTPGQLVDNTLLDEFENIAEASVFGGVRLRNVRGRAENVASGLIEDLVSRAKVATPKESGELLQLALQNRVDIHQRAIRGRFKKLEKVAGSKKVNIGNTQKLAAIFKKSLDKGLKSQTGTARAVTGDVLDRGSRTVTPAREGVPLFTSSGADTPEIIGARISETLNKVEISFSESVQLRSDLLSIGRVSGDALPARTQAMAKGLASMLDRNMETAARAAGPEVLGLWRNANALANTGHTAFNNGVMKKLIEEADPEAIVNLAVRNNRPSRIHKVRGFVEQAIAAGRADPNTWKAVQGEWLDKTFRAARDVEKGGISGKRLLGEIEKLGDEAGKELFPGGGLAAFTGYARTLASTQRKAGPGQTFAIALKLAQFGAVLDIAGGSESGFDRTSGAVILGPLALSFLFTNPRAVRWLTVGSTVPAGTRTASRAVGQLVSNLDQLLPAGSAFATEGVQGSTAEAPTNDPNRRSDRLLQALQSR